MDVTGVTWRKSSYSGSNGGTCVEVGTFGPSVAVRDSNHPDGPRLAFTDQVKREADPVTSIFIPNESPSRPGPQPAGSVPGARPSSGGALMLTGVILIRADDTRPSALT